MNTRGKNAALHQGHGLIVSAGRTAAAVGLALTTWASPLHAHLMPAQSGTLNVRGRMGSVDSEIYIGSAASVAAAAIDGAVADPRAFF